MQPFDLFKERLVRYRMTPSAAALGYEVVRRPKPTLAKSIAKIRLIVAGCAAIVMAVVFIGAMTLH